MYKDGVMICIDTLDQLEEGMYYIHVVLKKEFMCISAGATCMHTIIESDCCTTCTDLCNFIFNGPSIKDIFNI